MPNLISLDTDKADRAIAQLAALLSGEALHDVLKRAGDRAGVVAESLAGEYPEQSGKPLSPFYMRRLKSGKVVRSKFKSEAQQRKVMALLADGKIPYRRTGKLGASIVSETDVDPS